MSQGAIVSPSRAEPGAARRILVAEDQLVVREIVRTILTKAGFVVDVASDGAEACRLASLHAYDLVLMDVHMPVLGGVAATRKIRALEEPGRGVPIVAMTVEGEPSRVDELLEAGMSAHISKPFRHRELLDLIEGSLQP